jgi:Uma2 family endonuclease
MPSPTWEHANTVMNLILLLAPVMQSVGGQIVTAPLDAFFQGADPVQPDILVILPGWQGRLRQRGPEGAPDLAIEVLSPSSRGRDLLTKRALYARAGVREYWIVDPASRTVEILTLERDALRSAQVATGAESVVSPLLGDVAFPLETIFANVGGGDAEG